MVNMMQSGTEERAIVFGWLKPFQAPERARSVDEEGLEGNPLAPSDSSNSNVKGKTSKNLTRPRSSVVNTIPSPLSARNVTKKSQRPSERK